MKFIKKINSMPLSHLLPITVILIFFILNITVAQDLADFEKEITEFTLDNGLQFIILERHEAPVATFLTFANVGAVDEQRGKTGLAHLFEHMAFKGTRTIGTRDYKAEAQAMTRMDEIFAALQTECARPSPDPNRIQALQEQLEKAIQDGQAFLVHDEFEEALKRAGGDDLNAGTSADYTVYYVSLPSNKVELWMSMESDRFLNPVLREFYKEKDVVMEERRRTVDSNPIGRLLEEFNALAYRAHPYGVRVIGHMSDIKVLSRADAENFFGQYYIPNNLTIAIVGDVNPAEIQTLARCYFGRIPRGPQPELVRTVEPPQLGERRVVLEDPSQPFVLIGYHKPNINHPDNAVFEAITDIMGMGRTSRLYKALVKEQRIAVQTSGFPGWPGDKYPGLFLFYAVPAKNHTNAENERVILEQIERLKTEPVTPEDLRKAKTRARASLIRSLDSNDGLARQLAYYQVLTGDWRNLFRSLDQIEKVTAEDIQRVANEYFISTNRTVGLIETSSPQDKS
jgi:predicted Zn-dependent peptidase